MYLFVFVASPDFGETLAAVQGLLKKQAALETDLSVHEERVKEIAVNGEQLIDAGNYNRDHITQRCEGLKARIELLRKQASERRQKLEDNSAFLQFLWKADVVEAWIADREAHVRSEEYGRDLSSVQMLLTKQETFDAGLKAFEKEGIEALTTLKDQLLAAKHPQSLVIQKRYKEVMVRWELLRRDAAARKAKLLQLQEEYKQLEDLYLTFAKKASAFNSWFENAEEDLTDPVRCNNLEEIQVDFAPFFTPFVPEVSGVVAYYFSIL